MLECKIHLHSILKLARQCQMGIFCDCREMPGPHAQYHLHLLNDGRFPATVQIGFASQGGIQASTPPPTPAAAKTAAGASTKPSAAAGSKAGGAAGKGQAPAAPLVPAFQLSLQVVFLRAFIYSHLMAAARQPDSTKLGVLCVQCMT